MIQTQTIPEPKQAAQARSIQEAKTFLRDASHFQGEAQQVLFPESEAQVAQILRQAQQDRIPITVSGAGTGVTGSRVPQGGKILSTERFKRILKINWDGRSPEGTATVEPGVSLEALEEALKKQGLFYPPNPGEKKAFLGGTVATNASGGRSFKYGPTRSFIEGLRILLPNGDLLELNRGKIQSKQGSFTFQFSNGRIAVATLPTYTLPQTKHAAGYFAKKQMDLVDLFIGSEGTLGIVTQITLRVLKAPEGTLSGILFFETEKQAFFFAQSLKERLSSQPRSKQPADSYPLQKLELDPRTLEFFDSKSLALLMKKYPQIPLGAGSALYFEQECAPTAREELAQYWLNEVRSINVSAFSPWFSHQGELQEVFRKFRYDLPVLANERAYANGFEKIGTDLAVPESQAETLFDFYLSELPKSNLDYAIWGHLGDQHLHVNLFPINSLELRQAQKLYERLARKAIRLKGTVSAEHGIGKIRIPYLEMMVGRKGLKEMARLKKALDPAGLLNPGNIFPIQLLREA